MPWNELGDLIVDIGGGIGSLSALILERNPAMHAQVQDQEQIVAAGKDVSTGGYDEAPLSTKTRMPLTCFLYS